MPFIVAPPPVAPTVTVASGTLAERALDYLPEYVPASDDGTVAALMASWSAPVEGLAAMLTDPGLSSDPTRVPFDRLPWLAAMAGVDVSTVPNDQRRGVLRDPDWRYRGSRTAIAKRVGVTLTGARQVLITCPYLGDPLQIYVGTFASETPDADATLAAIRAEVPAWLVLTAEVDITGGTYNTLAATYADYNALAATGKTYSELGV